MGRPSKYKPEYAEKLVKYFDVPITRIVKEKVTYKNGTEVVNEKEVANELPFIAGFCAMVAISKRTFHDWVEKHDDFAHAYNIAKGMQEKMLAQNTLSGRYNAPFAIFTAKNILGWRDTQYIDETKHIKLQDLLGKYETDDETTDKENDSEKDTEAKDSDQEASGVSGESGSDTKPSADRGQEPKTGEVQAEPGTGAVQPK